MLVIVIIGILAAIAIPNFKAMQDRAKEATVKANMHTMQLAAEDYQVINGRYPTNVGELLTVMPQGRLRNPFSKDHTEPSGGTSAGDILPDLRAEGYAFRGRGADGDTLDLVLTSFPSPEEQNYRPTGMTSAQ